MSSHISDELPRLLTGDANRDVVMTAAEHLRTCPDCQAGPGEPCHWACSSWWT